MISQPHTPPECEHHWKSYLHPKNVGLRWIRQCSQCGDFDTVNLREQVAAAEQRGAARGWDEAIDYAWDDSSIYQADAARAKSKNPYRADRLEGDDE